MSTCIHAWGLLPIASCLLPLAICLLHLCGCGSLWACKHLAHSRGITDFLLPIAFCLLPIAYCLLPIAHIALLPIAYCFLSIAYCFLSIAYCLLPIACCLLPIALYGKSWKLILLKGWSDFKQFTSIYVSLRQFASGSNRIYLNLRQFTSIYGGDAKYTSKT